MRLQRVLLKLLPFTIVCFCGSLAANIPRLQGVAVRGRLLCGKVPLTGAKVKIIDVDTRPDLDDLLAVNYTDTDGNFELNGSTRELSTIETMLKIYHDCDDGIRPCQRKVVWHIPSSYHHDGIVKEYFDVGSVNMEIVFRGEERDCRH
ncbi:Transthyretin-like protein 46 [Toxocara canis]|uniref:Transthyretin-like protein 46 n=1 Tax=Toxocara canis TaxID=6265 RepID=A0A0B2VTD4_TOXCA|nr:Transthyretin-like protein 46 [Toxocara canis]